MKYLLGVLVILLIFSGIPCSSRLTSYSFQSNAKDLLAIFSRSIYKNSSDFIRELLSNAADALAIKRQRLLESGGGGTEEYKITIICDPVNRNLIFMDSGIGMNKTDMISNLGTFAKSGTKEMREKILKNVDIASNPTELIGQFGLGFYSSFMVADQVIVVSRKFQTDQTYAWICDIKNGSYSVIEIPENDPLMQSYPITTSGTKIILHIPELEETNEEGLDFLNPETLKKYITEYSQFISYPIYITYTKSTTVNQSSDELENENKDESVVVEDEESTEKKPIVMEEVITEHVNTQKPIWKESPSKVTEEQYNSFYKATFKDTSDPILHYQGSGSASVRTNVDFQYLIFIPRYASFKPFSNDAVPKFLKLFVKKVFVTDEFGTMFPKYLSFIRGVVDVDDLPLNISRESLQDLSVLKSVFKHLESKIIKLLQGLTVSMNNTEYENAFHREYAPFIKLGIIDEPDSTRKETLMSLLRFKSSFDATKTSLDSYVERMTDTQKDIYFVTGSSVKDMRKLPKIEKALKDGVEVLFLDDTFDEYVVQACKSYKGKMLVNLANFGTSTTSGDEVRKSAEEATQKFNPLISFLLEFFKSSVQRVVISKSLDRSPMAIVPGLGGISPQMEKMLRANKNDMMAQFYLTQKKIIEINPDHPLMIALLEEVLSNPEDSHGELGKSLTLLYHAALLHSGYELPDAADFAQRIEDLIRMKYGLDASQIRESVPEDLGDEKPFPNFVFPDDSFNDDQFPGMEGENFSLPNEIPEHDAL